MKKTNSPKNKLKLSLQTVRPLRAEELLRVAGGGTYDQCAESAMCEIISGRVSDRC